MKFIVFTSQRNQQLHILLRGHNIHRIDSVSTPVTEWSCRSSYVHEAPQTMILLCFLRLLRQGHQSHLATMRTQLVYRGNGRCAKSLSGQGQNAIWTPFCADVFFKRLELSSKAYSHGAFLIPPSSNRIMTPDLRRVHLRSASI